MSPDKERDCLHGKSVLITGHNGFLGGWLSAALTTVGAHVRGWSHEREPVWSPGQFLGIQNPVVSAVDIVDGAAVIGALRVADADLIVHLAGRTNVSACLKEPRAAFETNGVGTLNLLEAVRALGLRSKFVLASSDAALGNIEASRLPERGMDERQPPAFGEPYGTSKAVAELIASCYQTTYFGDRSTVAIVRFANAFGYGDPNARRVIPQFVLGALTEGVVRLKYRLNGRQFIYLTDLVAGFLAVCRWLLAAGPTEHSPASINGDFTRKPAVFHLASTNYPNTKEPFARMKDLAELVCATAGGRVDGTGSVDYAPNENRVQALNCDRTEALLGWHPSVLLPEGVALMTGWYSELRAPARSGDAGQARLVVKAMEQIVEASAITLNAKRGKI